LGLELTVNPPVAAGAVPAEQASATTALTRVDKAVRPMLPTRHLLRVGWGMNAKPESLPFPYARLKYGRAPEIASCARDAETALDAANAVNAPPQPPCDIWGRTAGQRMAAYDSWGRRTGPASWGRVPGTGGDSHRAGIAAVQQAQGLRSSHAHASSSGT
jgi:hypothetical protein